MTNHNILNPDVYYRMFLSSWLMITRVVLASVAEGYDYPPPEDFFLAFNGTETLFMYGGSKPYASNVAIYFENFQHEMGNAYPVTVSEPGNYRAKADISGTTYLTDAVTVSGVTVSGEGVKEVPWVGTGVNIKATHRQTGDRFGISVSISGDYAIVGAHLEDAVDNDSGAAYIFVRSGTSWTQQAKIQAGDAQNNDQFGAEVAISGDYAIVGSRLEDAGGADAGAAYIFVRSGTSWTQQAKIQSTDIQSGDYFGAHVAIDGIYAIVGARYEDTGGNNAGSAHIFIRSGTSWTQQAKIQSSDIQAYDNFSTSVSISGDYVIMGARSHDTGGNDAGAAYIFVRSGTSWTQQAKIQSSDIQADDQFGENVSISGDYVIVGTRFEDAGGADAGAAYIFVRSGTSWTQQAKIQSSDIQAYDNFSTSVAIDGIYAIVSTISEDTFAFAAGAAYIFKRSGTSWTQQTKIQASVREQGASFGSKVAMSGEYAIVGAYLENTDNVVDSGAAYIYSSAVTTQPNITAFHYGNFDTVYADADVSVAATNGRVFANTPTGTYNWGTLSTVVNTTTNTTYTWIPVINSSITDVLMVAGGGGGGGYHGGGGGSGGVLFYNNINLNGESKTVVVGNGGVGGGGLNSSQTSGGPGINTQFTGLSDAIGGGRGGGFGGLTSLSGGSGGGTCRSNPGTIGGIGTVGQGNNGGDSQFRGGGAGGGGAGGGVVDVTSANGTNGGLGVDYISKFGNIYGDNGYFSSGGGGGGGESQNVSGTASRGGGSNGVNSTSIATAARKHTGGGGGSNGTNVSTTSQRGANGGSGIILISYIPQLTHDSFDKLTVANTDSVDTATNLRLGSNVWDLGALGTVYICKPGAYKSFTVDPAGEAAHFGNVTVGSVTTTPHPLSVVTGGGTLAFHHNTFVSPEYDIFTDITTAAETGFIFSDTPLGTYNWGILNTRSLTSTGTTYTWTPISNFIATDLLIVAGGGGGGGTPHHGGGGGAGGVIRRTTVSLSGSCSVTVGSGAPGYSTTIQGYNSVLNDLTAIGGGAGGNGDSTGYSGGSGGGSGLRQPTDGGGDGTAGQGNKGGGGYTVSGSVYAASGGGGAGGVGENGSNTKGGNGGPGVAFSVSGTTRFYAGGGGGSVYNSTASGLGGSGGGGAGAYGNGGNGEKHTGGGGGGRDSRGTENKGSGNGGSGIVIMTYAIGILPASLSYDGYNKLSVIGVDAKTLYEGSNSYSLGTASTVFIADPGDYVYFTRTPEYALLSNVTVGAVTIDTFLTEIPTLPADLAFTQTTTPGTNSIGQSSVSTKYVFTFGGNEYEASALTESYGGTPDSAVFQAWHAFTKIDTAAGQDSAPYGVYSTNNYSNMPAWLKIKLYKPHVATSVFVKEQRNAHISAWKLQGSNDDSSWTDLYTGTTIGLSNTTVFPFSNYTAYQYYRLLVTSLNYSGGNQYFRIEDWNIFFTSPAPPPSLIYTSGTTINITGAETGANITWLTGDGKKLRSGVDLVQYTGAEAGSYKAEVSGATVFALTNTVTI